ncbi:hypothetical protein P8605_20120 [Streptomyces sp. T-3]|nr:hypothetical protein [Streptomyces sp. T-3]
MTKSTGRRRIRAVLGGGAAIALLLTGCATGQGGDKEKAPAAASTSKGAAAGGDTKRGKLGPLLRPRQIMQALPDAAALPGWKEVLPPMLDEDKFGCEEVLGAAACADVVASGSSDSVRGRGKPEEWLRASFHLYTCRSEQAAVKLYAALPSKGAKSDFLGDLGDQRGSVRYKTGPQTVQDSKVRVGKTVLWVFITGEERPVTDQRAKQATELLYDRTQQVANGRPATARLAAG